MLSELNMYTTILFPICIAFLICFESKFISNTIKNPHRLVNSNENNLYNRDLHDECLFIQGFVHSKF